VLSNREVKNTAGEIILFVPNSATGEKEKGLFRRTFEVTSKKGAGSRGAQLRRKSGALPRRIAAISIGEEKTERRLSTERLPGRDGRARQSSMIYNMKSEGGSQMSVTLQIGVTRVGKIPKSL